MPPKRTPDTLPRAGRPGGEDPATDLEALSRVIASTRHLFWRLARAARELHGDRNVTAGRGVLKQLAREGPMTVPQMARSRPVSRQHIQAHVNALVADRLVELTENPAHRRSRLVRLTDAGKRSLAALENREASVFGRLPLGVKERDLRAASETLDTLRRALESPEWQQLTGHAPKSE